VSSHGRRASQHLSAAPLEGNARSVIANYIEPKGRVLAERASAAAGRQQVLRSGRQKGFQPEREGEKFFQLKFGKLKQVNLQSGNPFPATPPLHHCHCHCHCLIGAHRRQKAVFEQCSSSVSQWSGAQCATLPLSGRPQIGSSQLCRPQFSSSVVQQAGRRTRRVRLQCPCCVRAKSK